VVDPLPYEITNLDVLAAYTHTMQEADTGRFVGRSLERVLREE
jgi:hypothetical protein